MSDDRQQSFAIVGMACVFPGAPDLATYWRNLRQGHDAIRQVPEDRWDIDAYFNSDPEVQGRMYARKGAFLKSVDQMDADFFGISPREATWVDPQQRVLLEVSWEALERAGWPAARCQG